MLPRFFIDRPVFAWVLALVLMLAGGIAVVRLPVMQYPGIAPPQVGINATYPGASAQTVQDSVVQVIEQQMIGIDGLDYITSESIADGTAQVTLTFAQGTNPDIAQVQVQNKLAAAAPLLPPEVQQQGLRVAKPTRNFLVVLGFRSGDNSMTSQEINNYVASNIGPAGRPAGRTGAGPDRDGHRAGAAVHAGAVRRHPAARERRRLAAAHPRRRPRRPVGRELRPRRAP